MKRTPDQALEGASDQASKKIRREPLERTCDYVKRSCDLALEKQSEDLMQKRALERAMRHFFKFKKQASLEAFVTQFESCQDVPFKQDIFQTAVKKCVKFDFADCFVSMCKAQFEICGTKMEPSRSQADCVFAYTAAIDGNRLNFISKAIEEKIFLPHKYCRTELHILVDLILEKKACDALVNVFQVLQRRFRGKACSRVVVSCVDKMLADESTWTDFVPIMNEWFNSEYDLDYAVMADALKKLKTMHSVFEVVGLKNWCVANGQWRVVLFLAVVRQDWLLLDTMVTKCTHLNLAGGLIRLAAFKAAKGGANCTGAKLLKHCPVTYKYLKSCCSSSGNERFGQLGKACEDQGLWDWACVLQCCEKTHVQELLRRCRNQDVNSHVLMEACRHEIWDLIRELQARCFEEYVLLYVLRKAISNGQVELVECLLKRVDLSKVVKYDRNDYDDNDDDDDDDDANDFRKSLLDLASQNGERQVMLKMVRLLVSTGVSTFQRDLPHDSGLFKDHVPAWCVLWTLLSKFDHIPTVKLMLKCGAYSHKSLHAIRQNSHAQHFFTTDPRVKQTSKRNFDCMMEAAATPFRLDNLARQAVSHHVGCRPGRSERIDALPLPEPLKHKVRFNDLLSEHSKKEDAEKDAEDESDDDSEESSGEDSDEEEDSEEETDEDSEEERDQDSEERSGEDSEEETDEDLTDSEEASE